MSIMIIGDVHGDTHIYQKMLRQRFKDRRTIQIGDMGIGFKGVGLQEMSDDHKWFRGNHDWPEKCRANKNYLGDFGYIPNDSLFYLAGGFSIDRDYRIAGLSWWPDEELSWDDLQQAIDLYKEKKPRFVISHEAPSEAGKHMLMGLRGHYFAAKSACTMSRTAEAMQVMLDAHQPERWVFAHYHVNREFEFKGTKFICIGIMGTYELETT